MSALLPCPFCGGTDLRPFVDQAVGMSDSHGIQCNGCDCAITGPERDTPEAAIAAWNRRHVPAGMVVVPVEPTEAMVLAAPGRTNQATEESMYHGIYRAMLAAAQEDAR